MKAKKSEKWSVSGVVVGGKFLGAYDAVTGEEAVELAREDASVHLCHQCSDECQDPEIRRFVATRDDEMVEVDDDDDDADSSPRKAQVPSTMPTSNVPWNVEHWRQAVAHVGRMITAAALANDRGRVKDLRYGLLSAGCSAEDTFRSGLRAVGLSEAETDAAVAYVRYAAAPKTPLGRTLNVALGLRLLLEAAETVEGYTRPGRGITRARQVEARNQAAEWIRSLPKVLTLGDLVGRDALAVRRALHPVRALPGPGQRPAGQRDRARDANEAGRVGDLLARPGERGDEHRQLPGACRVGSASATDIMSCATRSIMSSRFRVGDRVNWKATSGHDAELVASFKRAHGEGPYVVARARMLDSSMVDRPTTSYGCASSSVSVIDIVPTQPVPPGTPPHLAATTYGEVWFVLAP